MGSFFYRPPDSFAADFIPFYWNGDYHLFYLRDWRNAEKHGEGTPWHHLVTRDFVKFDDWGEALPRGPIGSQDVWIFTGCVMEHAGLFHIFYTAHNHHLKAVGGKTEGVAHATSPDLRTWTKHPGETFFAPDGYEMHDWRDPFVFRNEEAGEWWMLLAARRSMVNGVAIPSRYRGCTALCASTDLKNWRVLEPIYAPDQFYTHECPDLFRIGEWWYLIFSEFSERHSTRYRMSKSLRGPWIAPPNDAFDNRTHYAAKSASGDQRRFLFGWLPTRNNEKDDGGWHWGGELVTHEIYQEPDGTLSTRAPASVLSAFKNPITLIPGDNDVGPRILGVSKPPALPGDPINLDARGRLSLLPLLPMPQECLIETNITMQPWTHGAGLLLRFGGDPAPRMLHNTTQSQVVEMTRGCVEDTGYQVRIEPQARRVVIDRWPRPGDQPFMLERPLHHLPTSGPVTVNVKAIADGTCLVVYVDDKVALSCRMYEHRAGVVGLLAVDGQASFAGTRMCVRS